MTLDGGNLTAPGYALENDGDERASVAEPEKIRGRCVCLVGVENIGSNYGETMIFFLVVVFRYFCGRACVASTLMSAMSF